MTPQIVVVDGPWKGAAFPISGEPLTIGRKPENTLAPADLSISRQHCTIEQVNGQHRIQDHDSQNGTFVNGIPVRERWLVHGDQIAVGSSVFVFLCDPEDSVAGILANPAERPAVPAQRIVGETPAIRHVLEFIGKVAPLHSTVLITGEKGTGKKLAARVLHEASPRAQRPLVEVNCAALSETLLESDLFGHERGAYGGAVARKHGKVEMAEGGTLVLDEVAALTPALQEKLLRLLEQNQFERMGGMRPLTADLRVLASTSQDLSAAVQSGAFRRDLYFRLCVLSVALPALRDRREDITLLANFFRLEQSIRQKRRVVGLTAAARDCLLRYNWPGNVAELESAIEAAVSVGSTEGILPEDLPESVLPGVDAPDDLLPRFNRAIIETRRELILKAYQQARGSHAQAAALLGLHPSSLHRLVRSLELEPALASLR